MSKLNKDWLDAATVRAIRTIAQTALSMLTVGMTILDVDWIQLISISLVAGLISILTSLVTGLPESTTSGMLVVDPESDGEGPVMGLKLDGEVTPESVQELLDKGTVNLRVRK